MSIVTAVFGMTAFGMLVYYVVLLMKGDKQ